MKSSIDNNENSLQAARLGTFRSNFNMQKAIFFLAIPGIIWYIIFKYAPMAGSLAAFTDMGTKADTSFIGFENFVRLMKDPGFWVALKNTLLLSFLYLFFYFPLPIIIALLINEVIFVRIQRVVQFIIYIPHFFSWVVVGAVFVIMLSPRDGFVNQIIMSMGGDSIYFMVDSNWFRQILVSSHIWRDVGYGTIIYIATISTIDPQLYEAAIVDGAGYWGRVWHITLPSLRTTIATVLFLTVARVLLIFEQVFVMYSATVYDVADVLTTYSYRVGLLQGNIGFATAVSIFTAVVSAFLVIGCNLASKKVFGESII